MRPTLQSRQEVIIRASLKEVWEYNQDLSKIPSFHPRVDKVDLLSGKQFRAVGVEYQCHIAGSKHTCVEKDIEIVPMQKIVTVFPRDTMGLSKLLPDYVVESCVIRIGDKATRVEISHYYSSSSWKVRLLNFYIKKRIGRETQEMLAGMKNGIEMPNRRK